MRIRTYIINLKKSTNRKEYMERLLIPYPQLDINFIEAVDGRLMNDGERANAFDMQKCVLRYGREINPGEIGCTLSHYKIYNTLVNSTDEYALVLEDDISIVGNINFALSDEVQEFMQSSEPRILFLSGDYWYWRRKPVARVLSAVGSYAYYINKSAAELILKKTPKPYNVADDWDLYRGYDVALYAIHPYVIDANITGMESEIKQSHWGNLKSRMSMKNILESYSIGIVKKILVYCGHFESKIRI